MAKPPLSTPMRLLILSFLSETLFLMPVVLIYYQSKGANLSTFLVLQGFFRLSLFLLEIPTGYIADKWHRHHQLAISRVTWLLSLATLYFASGVTGIMASELLAALACALRSGTLDAYLHETLKAEGLNARQTTAWQYRLHVASMTALALSAALGGWMFSTPEAPLLASIIFACAALLLGTTLPDVPRVRTQRHHKAWKDLLLVAKYALFQHPRLSAIIWGPYVLYAFTSVLFWAFIARLEELGVAAGYIGMALCVHFALSALYGKLMSNLLDHIGERAILMSLPVWLVIGTALMLTSSPWLVFIGGLLGVGLVHSVGRPLTTSLINHEASGGERATIQSVASSVTVVLSGLFLLAAQPVLKHATFSTLLVGCLCITLAIAAWPLYRLTTQPQPAAA